ncbi:serine phosphatase RsbU (regulator of sigma subunit)/anti-sigma regulatory factor (Ser/Thr protein kinase) [Kitasatospora gansuensis]|uniref:protein-serine/threonine phosphatase n=1 Tax=Kitasatospora gansuensis TaxID=258050 RepID=A0A7W7SCE6_9ACTN|nr:SpoIIE family protein phosphatase [Kitasatospora gansuensis]MBB4947905.1 serine phosphatase RsbU (regulator of sigma subunit)/anti-sigma regulatory factor (Ser/Thr protein kinase) [Kitasatospora gansuensis]
MVDQPDSPPSADQPAVVALVRLAVVLIDPDGRITYWSRAAEELFGHRAEVAFGRTASGLLPAVEPRPEPLLPRAGGAARRCDALDTLGDLTQTGPAPWAGSMAVVDREERLRDVFWWAYPLTEPTGRGLLALAADARPLRAGGPRIALGSRQLPFTPSPGPVGGLHRLRPDLAPAGQGDTGPLAALLSTCSEERRHRLLGQLRAAGLPALWVDATTRLPVQPYEPAGTARAAATGLGRRYPTAQQRAAQPRAGRRPAEAQRPATGGSLQVLANGAGSVPAPRDASPSTSTGPTPGGPAIESAADRTRSNGTGGWVHKTVPPRPPVASPIASPAAAPAVEVLTSSPAGEQLALLSEVGSRVGTTLDLDTTARELCEVLVPSIADFACVDLRDGLISDSVLPTSRPSDNTMLRRVARSFNATVGQWEHVLEEGALLAMPRSTPPGLALQENHPVLVPVINPDVAVDYAASLGGPELVPVVMGRSMLVLPLSARGTVLGILKLLRLPDRAPFDHADAATLRELAARAALSLDNARLHRMEAKTATILQRSMIPTRPPKIPGVQIAHRYLPGDQKAEVGGDWFDAIQLPGSRVALVVGDVMGHGLLSAAAMGRFRTAMQTLAALDLPPGQLLRHLDNLAHKLGDDHLATCLYAVYDPINRTCELASAGHVPPVLVHPDGTGELLEIPSGAPIGVGGVPFVSKKIDVSDGSMLVLCTDGLVEVRGGDIGAGLAALCGNLIDPKQSPEEACDVVLERLHSEDRQDDIALLVARFDGVAPTEVATWELAVDETEVRRARRLVREQLAAWQLTALTDTVELLVSELVTNAVRVARDHVQLQLIRVDKLLVEVSDDNHNLPSLEPSEELDENGRGLNLVSKLAEKWGTARKAVGKVVWFELMLPRS